MALKFALITEGASEHCIIKHLLQRYCSEEPEIHQIQPQLVNGKQDDIGGWCEVLKYCEREEALNNILAYNDYVVIQIDTEYGAISHISVSKSGAGGLLNEEQLCMAVQDRLLQALPETIDRSRFIFAISVDMIECWLLPIYCLRDAAACQTNNCLDRLNRELGKKDIHKITKKNSFEAQRTYSNILSNIRKKKDIQDCASHHHGFSSFLTKLESIGA